MKPPTFFTVACNKQKAFRKGQKEEAIAIIVAWFWEVVALPQCYNHRRTAVKCSCLHSHFANKSGLEWAPFVAEWLYNFYATKKPSEQDEFVFERVKECQHRGQNAQFTVPSIGKPEGQDLVSVCKNAYLLLLGVGGTRYRRLLKSVSTNILQPHCATGKTSNNAMKGSVSARLKCFFEDMVSMAAPRATRFVRIELGIDVRDSEVELQELPSFWTARHLYCRFVEECGYKATLKSHKGVYKIEPLETYDDEDGTSPQIRRFAHASGQLSSDTGVETTQS